MISKSTDRFVKFLGGFATFVAYWIPAILIFCVIAIVGGPLNWVYEVEPPKE